MTNEKKCTCEEPHISKRITHCYDGKPCYITDSVSTTEEAPKCKTSSLCSHNTNGRDINKPCSILFSPHALQEASKNKVETVGFMVSMTEVSKPVCSPITWNKEVTTNLSKIGSSLEVDPSPTWQEEEREAWYDYTGREENLTVETTMVYWLARLESRIASARREEREKAWQEGYEEAIKDSNE